MQLDQVKIGVRERNHFDVMDLALVVMRRHWVGLGACALVGVAPFFAVNVWMTQQVDEMDRGPFHFVYAMILVMQVPWATSLITLYLGQATFHSNVSVRKMVNDWFGSLGQMILFQVVLRAIVTVLTVVLFGWVLLALRFRYANEIILLERNSVWKAWKRSGGFHSAHLSRIMSDVFTDYSVCFGAVVLLTHGLISISEMLSISPDGESSWAALSITDVFAELIGNLYPALSWQGQASLWIVLCFLTVVRFLSYIDCRIRREGWDVELKLRTQGSRVADEVW